jgi:hypothetical protein
MSTDKELREASGGELGDAIPHMAELGNRRPRRSQATGNCLFLAGTLDEATSKLITAVA